MATCYLCKKHVTVGRVVCDTCAGTQAVRTRFVQMTATPEALAAWLDKIYNVRSQYSFGREYCKGGCEDEDDCRHELQYIVDWLNEQVEEKTP